jgi:glycine/D-amino acid oxidase-like deaminating enzyme
VELDSRVRAVRRAGSGYAVELDDRSYEAEQVVIATGPFQVPFVPAIADGLGAAIVQMHSTAYRSPGSVPNHVHGAGRFLVLSRDGVTEPNLVWKDTVLVRAGDTVDILLDVTNVGRWMAHCHIAEHHESGMMFSFEVTE